MKIVVTGAAGFIGAHVCRALGAIGDDVWGVDNFNSYYDPALKRARVAALCPETAISQFDISDTLRSLEFFDRIRPEVVIHLAAQAGVRHSIEHPEDYTRSNLVGFANVLEACRRSGVEHLLYASSSSVYGDAVGPLSEGMAIGNPLSYYAATKAANEAMAHSYANIFGFHCTGLRFFTVYGPWGRPDMALFKFVDAIVHGQPIQLYNEGRSERDFTYIDDIVTGIARLIDKGDGNQVFNLGSNYPVKLTEYVEEISSALGATATTELLPMQAGDVAKTHANIEKLAKATGFRPSTPVSEGVGAFVRWYLEHRQEARAA